MAAEERYAPGFEILDKHKELTYIDCRRDLLAESGSLLLNARLSVREIACRVSRTKVEARIVRSMVDFMTSIDSREEEGKNLE